MKLPDEFDWNEEEREALAALGREVEPGPDLEERTVALLRAEGLVQAAPAPPGTRLARWILGLCFPPWIPPRGPRLAWATAGAAVLAAVFFAGVSVGQRSALRTAADVIATVHEDAAMQASVRVQRTGSAYVAALAALGQLAATSDSQDLSQGREVALVALHAAVAELVALDPGDSLATRLLLALEAEEMEEPPPSQVVWF